MALAADLDIVEWGESPEARLTEDYKEMAERFEGAKAFEILGINETDSEAVAKKAYLDIVKRYHPDKLPKGVDPEIQKLAEKCIC